MWKTFNVNEAIALLTLFQPCCKSTGQTSLWNASMFFRVKRSGVLPVAGAVLVALALVADDTTLAISEYSGDSTCRFGCCILIIERN